MALDVPLPKMPAGLLLTLHLVADNPPEPQMLCWACRAGIGPAGHAGVARALAGVTPG